jgi:hypothetical protein
MSDSFISIDCSRSLIVCLILPALLMVLGCGSVAQDRDGGAYYSPHSQPVPNWSYQDWNVRELSTGSDAEYLTELEKDVILHLNMARTNPEKYADDFIRPRLQYFQGVLYREPEMPILITTEGAEALEECIRDMEDTDPMTALTPSYGITMAAADHAVDLSLTGGRGHVGSDNSEFTDRIERYGSWETTAGEVISYGPVTGREIVVGLLIDDGVTDRGHRSNVLNPAFHLAGVSVEDHDSYGNVCVVDLAGGFVPNGE